MVNFDQRLSSVVTNAVKRGTVSPVVPLHPQDMARSESMEGAMKLAQLNPLLRQAISLIKALNIKQEGGCFVLEVRCGLLRCA